jgi:hypothetical protein
MNHFKKTIIAGFAIYAAIAIALLLFGDHEKIVMIGLTGLLLSIAYLFIGIILCIPASGREIGKGLLLCSGLILIIGLSVCTVNPMNFNVH